MHVFTALTMPDPPCALHHRAMRLAPAATVDKEHPDRYLWCQDDCAMSFRTWLEIVGRIQLDEIASGQQTVVLERADLLHECANPLCDYSRRSTKSRDSLALRKTLRLGSTLSWSGRSGYLGPFAAPPIAVDDMLAIVDNPLTEVGIAALQRIRIAAA